MELGRGSFAEMEWPFIYLFIFIDYLYLYLLIIYIYRIFTFKYSIPGQNKKQNKHIFFVLRPVTLPQPGLGRIAEQVQV